MKFFINNISMIIYKLFLIFCLQLKFFIFEFKKKLKISFITYEIK